MNYTVLGIDPGGTTGIARLTRADHHWILAWHELERWEELGGTNQLSKLVASSAPDLIAIERFVVGRRAARSRNAAAAEAAREIIGVVSQLGYPLTRNNAADVKRWATDRRLAAMRIELPSTKGGHARDATRHALYAMRERRWCPDPLAVLA